MRRKLKIPGVMEWSGYETDLDVRDAHRMMFGKSIEEVQGCFGDLVHRLRLGRVWRGSPAVIADAQHRAL
jgi:hypothetical protein